MTSLTTAQLRQAIEISKRCDTLGDQLASVIVADAKDFSVDVFVNSRPMTISMSRDLVEDQLRDLLNNSKANLQALGITHLEATA